MAVNFLTKNKKVFEVFLRRSTQNSNLPVIIAGSRGLNTSTPSETFSEDFGVRNTKICKDNFSSYAGWVMSKSQPYGQISNMKRFDEIRTSGAGSGRESWTIAHEHTFVTQPEKTFLLGNNAMITTYSSDDASTIVYQCGPYKYALPSHYANLRCAANLPDGSFVICDKKELTFFSSDCEYLTSNKLITGNPYSMAVDSNGNIFVGMLETNTIAVYHSDGSFGGLFHTESGPLSLAVTANDQLVVSFVDGSVQLVDLQDSTVSSSSLIIIKPPSLSPREWQPTRVCCSKEGGIFVVDWGQGAVYQYSPYGEYEANVCEGLKDPQDIAVSEDGRELQVFESGLSAHVETSHVTCVKTFKLGNK